MRHVTDGQVGDRLNVEAVQPVVKPGEVVGAAAIAAACGRDDAVLDYAVRIARATRSWPGVAAGAGPRGGIALVRGARARRSSRAATSSPPTT